MKRILTIIWAMVIAVISATAQEKQHSLEITTGYPSILFLNIQEVIVLWK